MILITSKRFWQGYKKTQENRAAGLSPQHSPDFPDEYPCLVVTSMTLGTGSVTFSHQFAYLADAKKLMKYADNNN